MMMTELEQDILTDLKELADPISQYTFLIACAGGCPPFPEEYRSKENLVRECQVNTWMHVTTEDDKVLFQMDSEALIVKGALSLLVELYHGRPLEEVRKFSCSLPEHEDFSRHFNKEQLDGVKAIIKKLSAL